MDLELWFRDIVERRSAKVPRVVRVVGVRDKHLGPRCDYARVVVEAEPANQFSVIGPTGPLTTEGELFLRAAVYGVLDVVLTAEPFPLRDFALRIVEIQSHPVDSSIMAFRRAGRDAGKKLLQEAGLGEK
jgi:hypothetical protein